MGTRSSGRWRPIRHNSQLRSTTSTHSRFVSCHQPVLTDADGIRRQILAANSSDRCIGVIAWMHTFSPAKMWIAGLVALQKPLLHLHSQFHRELPWSEIDMDYMNLHQSAHGDREFAHLLTRMRVRRKTVAGHVDDPGVGERIGTWVRAAQGGTRPTRCVSCASATTCVTLQ